MALDVLLLLLLVRPGMTEETCKTLTNCKALNQNSVLLLGERLNQGADGEDGQEKMPCI